MCSKTLIKQHKLRNLLVFRELYCQNSFFDIYHLYPENHLNKLYIMNHSEDFLYIRNHLIYYFFLNIDINFYLLYKLYYFYIININHLLFVLYIKHKFHFKLIFDYYHMSFLHIDHLLLLMNKIHIHYRLEHNFIHKIHIHYFLK